jgi:hypothetical protein
VDVHNHRLRQIEPFAGLTGGKELTFRAFVRALQDRKIHAHFEAKIIDAEYLDHRVADGPQTKTRRAWRRSVEPHLTAFMPDRTVHQGDLRTVRGHVLLQERKVAEIRPDSNNARLRVKPETPPGRLTDYLARASRIMAISIPVNTGCGRSRRTLKKTPRLMPFRLRQKSPPWSSESVTLSQNVGRSSLSAFWIPTSNAHV